MIFCANFVSPFLRLVCTSQDSKELSINELLTSYRTEVPVVASDDEGSSGGSDDEDIPPKSQLYRNAAAPVSQSRAYQSGTGQVRSHARE